jgi:hypothetical protein
MFTAPRGVPLPVHEVLPRAGRLMSQPEDGEIPATGLTPLGRLSELAMNLSLTVPSSFVNVAAPARPLALDELRLFLLRASTPGEARDQVWRHVGERARAERGDWNLFALGLAYPGLIRRAFKLGQGKTFPQRTEMQFRLAGEFLFALHRLDLAAPNLVSRLIGAAYDQASGRKNRTRTLVVDIDALDAAHLPQQDHHQASDLFSVLERLVHETSTAPDGHRFTDQHAELVARTYLDGEKLYAVAANLRMSPANASKQRARAVTLIAISLQRPDLIQP